MEKPNEEQEDILVRLENELANVHDGLSELLDENYSLPPEERLDITEFLLDAEEEKHLLEEAEKTVLYEKIKLDSLNGLRTQRITHWRNLVWDRFETKGCRIRGFNNKVEIPNYAIEKKSESQIDLKKQLMNERKLELKMMSREKNILRRVAETTFFIIQHEFDPSRRGSLLKTLVSLDPSLALTEGEVPENLGDDEEFLQMIYSEASVASAVTTKAPKKVQSQYTKGTMAKKAANEDSADKSAEDESEKKPVKKIVPEGGTVLDVKVLLERKKTNEIIQGFEKDDEKALDFTKISLTEGLMRLGITLKPHCPPLHAIGVFGPSEICESDEENLEVLLAPTTDKGGELRRSGGLQQSHQKPKKSKPNLLERDASGSTIEIVIESDDDLSDEDADYCKLQQKNQDDTSPSKTEEVSNAFHGSRIPELKKKYGYKANCLSYQQFELTSRQQLVRQFYFVQDEIRNVKIAFNKVFEEMKSQKAIVLRTMAERNKRIREIYYYLRMDLDSPDYGWYKMEDPSHVFIVKAKEVPVSKYLTEEEQRQEQEKLEEAKARKRTRMAKFRRKALVMMMDGKLETKREEILINDVPKPSFMLEKDEYEYSLEEYVLSLEYQEAVEALEEKREVLRKELRIDLAKHFTANAQDANAMDKKFNDLYLTRLDYHSNILMEESRLIRIQRQLEFLNELEEEEEKVHEVLSSLRATIASIQSHKAQLKTKIVISQDRLKELQDQIEIQDYSFKKDLGDVGNHFDFFLTNFKKKPKLDTVRGDKFELYSTVIRGLESENLRSFGREPGAMVPIVARALIDFETLTEAVEGMSRSTWDRFLKIRRQKLVNEYQAKTLEYELQNLTEALEASQKREDIITKCIAAVLGVLSHKFDLRTYFTQNIEFQIVLSKGQVEIPFWDLQAHQNSLMMLPTAIQELNRIILNASANFLAWLKKTIDLNREVKQIEWRFRVVRLTQKNLKNLCTNIRMSRPSKDLLAALRTGSNIATMYDGVIQGYLNLLSASKQFQAIYMKTKRRILSKYLNEAMSMEHKNEEYGRYIKNMNQLVSMKNYHRGFNTKDEAEVDENKRVLRFLKKGYMTRKVHQNNQIIECLESELEKEYRKAFPVL